MGFLSRIFGGSKSKHESTIQAPPCPHLTLVPRWDAAEDIGQADKATSFTCEACGERFTPEQAAGMNTPN